MTERDIRMAKALAGHLKEAAPPKFSALANPLLRSKGSAYKPKSASAYLNIGKSLPFLSKLKIGGAIGLTSLLGYIIWNMNRRTAWQAAGAGGPLSSERSAEPLIEYRKRMQEQNAKIQAFADSWQKDTAGGYINPTTGAITGSRAYNAKINEMRQQATQEQAKWLVNKYRGQSRKDYEDPVTGEITPGSYMSSKRTAADADYIDWKSKYDSNSGWFNPIFWHHATPYAKRNNPWKFLFGTGGGSDNPIEQEKRDIAQYRSGMKTPITRTPYNV